MGSIISVSGINKSFGQHHVLSDVSFALDSGSIYGLVGLNGAGKTTLLRLLLGLLKPDSGTINIAGFDPWKHQEAFYANIGVVLENDGFWGNLTIKENLKIFAAAKKISWTDTIKYIEQFWGDTVIGTSDKFVKHLSRGQRMQCALCRAFLGWPQAVFLDEPAIALDMSAYEHFKTIATNAKNNGAALIISSHQLDTIDDLCDRVGNLSEKKLADLSAPKNKSRSWWILRSDNNEKWLTILNENNCSNIEWKNDSWHFSVNDSQADIPIIIRKLVESNCNIYEIKQDTSGFGETIRTLYRSI